MTPAWSPSSRSWAATPAGWPAPPPWPRLTGCGPDLVYLPETDFDMDQFLADVKAVYDKTGKCMVAVSEGIHYADGTFVSEAKTSATDGFGHAQLGGLASMLAETVKQKTGRQGPRHRALPAPALRRPIWPPRPIWRRHIWPARPLWRPPLSGITDKMVAFQCTRDGSYACKTVLEPLDIVANFEKKVPRAWINEAGQRRDSSSSSTMCCP